MLFTSQIKLKSYELATVVVREWSQDHLLPVFTHIAYKGEDRKRKMKNSLGQKLLNDL